MLQKSYQAFNLRKSTKYHLTFSPWAVPAYLIAHFGGMKVHLSSRLEKEVVYLPAHLPQTTNV